MYLVGIISDNKNIIYALNKKKEFDKVNFIELDTNTIENFRNIKFDIILISNLGKSKKNYILNKILSNASITVINADIKQNLSVLDNLKGIVITYGFNAKATITASSVDDNNISICVQRIIENINKEKIEPIEYVENIGNVENIEISDVIEIKTIEKLLTKKKN